MSAATARPEPADLLARRRQAIEVSGWGTPFHFVQLRNACFWVYLAMVASGAWYAIHSVAPTAGVFAAAYTATVLSTGAFALLFLLFLHWADRFERTPGGLVVAAFVVGGFGATFAIAITGNAALGSLYTKTFGQVWAVDWDAGLSAPFVEETAKGAGFLLLMGLAPIVVRTAYDGLMVGAYVGLGFQILEDMLYSQNSAREHFGADQVDSVLSTFGIRALTGVPSHALYTALFSAGLVYVIGTVAQPRRLGRGIALMLAAVVAHGVWDSMSAITGGSFLIFVLMIAVTAFSVAALFVAIRWGAGREHSYLHDILAPEVAAGVITEEELTALTGSRRQRRAAVRAHRASTGRRAQRHVLHAARDLAEDLAEAGGAETVEVGHSRAEVSRLRGR